MPKSAPHATAQLRPLLLGMGWFPDQAGGLNRYFRDLYRAFTLSGVEVSGVVVGPADGADANVSAVPTTHRRILSRVVDYYRRTNALAEKADIVDSHFALYTAVPSLIGLLRRKPLVVHFQGPWADESASINSAATVKLKRVLERVVYRRARGAITLSGAFKQMLVERYGVLPWNVDVIAAAVDLDTFAPGNCLESRGLLGISPNAFLAVTVRRLVARMGLDVLLDAWRDVVALHSDAVLAIVGEGELRVVLERRAAIRGISANVRFIGKAADSDLVHWYRAANVSVIPSVAFEGFGLVTLESLACGTPVIGTDVGGIPEVLAPLSRSLLVRAGDERALASRLLAAAEVPAALPRPVDCRSYANNFSWDNVVLKTLAVYERAVRPPRQRKLRVVYVDHCARLSGGELALLRVLPALQLVDAHVLLGETGPLVKALLQRRVSVEVLAMPRSARGMKRDHVTPKDLPPSAGLGTAWYILRLAYRLRRLKPDIVHTNSLKAAVYAGVACRLAGVPCVWHIRDRIAPDYLPEPAVRFVRWLAPKVASAVIANSQTTLATLNLPKAVASVICSPVVFDPITVQPGIHRNGHHTFTVGMVGRIAPWKGQHVFVDAFAQAFPNGPQRGVIVGAPLFGEDQYAETVRAQAGDLGLNSRMDFLGFQQDIIDHLTGFDALVHASVLPEPFGQVVVEGMAAGLPVIAARAGGPAEVIEDGVTGLLYEPGDVEALAGTLRRVAEDADLRKRIGDAAQTRARDFAPEIIAKQIFNVYRGVLEGTAKASQLILS